MATKKKRAVQKLSGAAARKLAATTQGMLPVPSSPDDARSLAQELSAQLPKPPPLKVKRHKGGA